MRNLVLKGINNVTGDHRMSENFRVVWEQVRNPVVVPVVQATVYLCIAMSLLLSIERVYMTVMFMCVKLMRKKSYTLYKLDRVREEVEANKSHPRVLVQVPMYNEREVYRLSIGAVCNLSWPSDRIIIQVLDDSTDPVIKELVELECQKWASTGVNIKYETRNNRNGYKAGALRDGLKKNYAKDCDYVAIFDADFQPEADYLWRTVPFLVTNPELALVQARWNFVNADECLLTRLQEMSLDYHFIVEQELGSSTYSFFGFNGTAGVWRIQAIADSGGWKDRTTVEDMDLAIRACLKGWKFVFISDLSVKNELPSTFRAYKCQQHRWSCGPANLFRKMFKEIISCKRVSLWKKFHLLYEFFFVRKIVAHFVTFFFYCIVIPACVFVPEVYFPKFIGVYIPSFIAILNALCTPRSLHLLMFWILFENVMSMHRAKAAIIGLFETNRVYEWIVTEKLGSTTGKQKGNTKTLRRTRSLIGERIHMLELFMGLYLLNCAIYDVMLGPCQFYIFLVFQAATFFIMGFGYVGILMPN